MYPVMGEAEAPLLTPSTQAILIELVVWERQFPVGALGGSAGLVVKQVIGAEVGP